MIERAILAAVVAFLALGALVDFTSAFLSRLVDLMFAAPVLLGAFWLYRSNRKLRAQIAALKKDQHRAS